MSNFNLNYHFASRRTQGGAGIVSFTVPICLIAFNLLVMLICFSGRALDLDARTTLNLAYQLGNFDAFGILVCIPALITGIKGAMMPNHRVGLACWGVALNGIILLAAAIGLVIALA